MMQTILWMLLGVAIGLVLVVGVALVLAYLPGDWWR